MKERPAVPAPMTRYVACVVEDSPPLIGLPCSELFVYMICCTIQATIIVSTTGRRLVKDKCKTLPQRSFDGRVDIW